MVELIGVIIIIFTQRVGSMLSTTFCSLFFFLQFLLN